MKLTHLSNNHFAISDANAGRLARATARGKLPRWGYEIDVTLPDGRVAVLKRTQLLPTIDPVKNGRGWVWSVMPTGR